MKRFLFLQLWLGVLIIGVFIYYRERGNKEEHATSSLRFLEEKRDLQDILFLDSLHFAEQHFPLGRMDFQRVLMRVLKEDFFHQQGLVEARQRLLWLSPIQEALVQGGVPSDLAYCALAMGTDELYAPFATEESGGFWRLSKEVVASQQLRTATYWDERYHPVLSTEALIAHLREKKGERNWLDVFIGHLWGPQLLDSLMQAQGVDKFYNVYGNTPAEEQQVAKGFSLLLRAVVLKQLQHNLRTVSISTHSKHRRYSKRPIRVLSVRSTALRLDTLIAPYQLKDYAQQQGYKVLRAYNPWWRVPYDLLAAAAWQFSPVSADITVPDTLLFCLPPSPSPLPGDTP